MTVAFVVLSGVWESYTSCFVPAPPTRFALAILGLLSVQFSRSVMSNSLWLHEPQHARPPCPSPTPGACSNSSIKSVMPSNHLILRHPLLLSSCPQSFPASGSFQMSQLFASGGQSGLLRFHINFWIIVVLWKMSSIIW